MRTGNISRVDAIYRAFKSYVAASGSSPIDVAADLERFSHYYERLVTGRDPDPQVASALGELAALRTEVAYPFLLDVFDDHAQGKLDRTELHEVLRVVVAYVFRRAIVGLPSNALNKIFAVLSREVDEERYIESFRATLLLKESGARFPRDDEFRRELRVKDIYHFRSRGYLLHRLENHGRKEIVPTAAYTVEHVLPQNPDLSPEWQEELGPEWQRIQSDHLHTLGNLTLTGYNAELSDRPFPAKRTMPGGFNESPIRLNESVRAATRWDEEAITGRGANLAELAVSVWPAPRLAPDVLERYRTARQRVRSAYTLEDHAMLTGPMRELFNDLKRRILNLGTDVEEDIRKQSIGFKSGRIFVSVVPLKNELKLYLGGLNVETVDDPQGMTKDVRGIGHWGAGDIETRIESADQMDAIMDLIEQAFVAVDEGDQLDGEFATEGIERVIELAPTLTDQQTLRRLVDVAVSGGLYPRPWKRVVMFTPPQNRSVSLFSVRVGSGGQLETICDWDNWGTFAGIAPDRAGAALGPDAWKALAGDHEIARLVDALEDLLAEAVFPGRPRRKAWAGQDYYVILGEHSWDDCRRYGFVTGCGGSTYTRPLEMLSPGSRVYAYYSTPQRGYVGVGVVTGTSVPIRDFHVEVAGQSVPFLDAPMQGRAKFLQYDPDDLAVCSYMVPVTWQRTVDIGDGLWETGFFANQNVVCRMRDDHTRDRVLEFFELRDTP